MLPFSVGFQKQHSINTILLKFCSNFLFPSDTWCYFLVLLDSSMPLIIKIVLDWLNIFVLLSLTLH